MFPVLPASIFESPAGTSLQELYDLLVELNGRGNPTPIDDTVCSITDLLTPIAQMAYNWSLPSVNTIACGLVLETGKVKCVGGDDG